MNVRLSSRRSLSRTVIEKFLAGSVTQAQLARRYDLSPHLIIQWRNNYASGKLADLERNFVVVRYRSTLHVFCCFV